MAKAASQQPVVHYVALTIILQVAFQMLTNGQQRAMLQNTAPLTAFMLITLAAVAASVAAGAVEVEELALVDELLFAEPWRLLSCFLVYVQPTALAGHLYLLLKAGPVVEARLGSKAFGRLLGFSAAASLALRGLLLQPAQRPPLLTAAPLFCVLLIYSQGAAAQKAPLLTARLPWVLVSPRGSYYSAFAGCGANPAHPH